MIKLIIKFVDKIICTLFYQSKKNNKVNFEQPKTIRFEDNSYYISNKRFNIIDIFAIYYSVSSITDKYPTYYIKLLFNENKVKVIFNQGFQVVDINNLINTVSNFNIPLLPTIIPNGGVYVVKGFSLSLDYECYMHEKYLINIYFNDLNKDFFKNISIEDLLENPNTYTSSNNKNKFSIKILSNKLTLNRGYGAFPMLNNEIIIKDIFYSFNEEKIKSKIIELFNKYDIE